MYLIFDSEDTCVGTVLRHAVENTTIAEALHRYGFYLVEVDEMGNPKAYDENKDNYEPDDIDCDCGYDPYLGCYTDDC